MKENKQDDEEGGPAASASNDAPAGNAIYDPRQQTRRRDLEDEPEAQGEPRRGTAPPRPQDLPGPSHSDRTDRD
jgi:hypothetical protein